jgi:hypothetical protein
MHAAGFNASTDGGVQDNGTAQASVGINGMVWVDAYNNATCVQTLSNAQIQAMVQANVNAGLRGLRYQIGDEPTANGCNAPPVYLSITAAVHAVDATAKTWADDDQFQVGNPVIAGIPMQGTVDILAFDVYPCESGPCQYSAIDSAVAQIHAAHLTNWEFIIQDFVLSPWRWPTPTEIQTQFDHWKNQGAIGYWVFAWDYLGQQMINQPGNIAAVQSINSQAINGSSPPPSPSPSPSPSPPPPPADPCAGPALFTTYFNWYDNASPGMLSDDIHLLNSGGATSTGCVTTGGLSIPFSLAAAQETLVTFPMGTIGGPAVVTVNSGPPVLASKRSWYYQSLSETLARPASAGATSQYFPWYDLASPGMNADTFHITNVSGASVTGTIALHGASFLSFSVADGQDIYLTFPYGTIGGPVTVSSSGPVLAMLRGWYYSSLTEMPALPLSAAATQLYMPWYDLSSAGMRADTIHITNVGGSAATGTIALGAKTINFTVDPMQDSYFAFPQGTIGGPVTINSSQPVLASLRSWYYQSFSETAARPSSAAATHQAFTWYDLASPGMNADTIHITNVSGASAAGTISVPGATPISFTVASGQDSYFTFPQGTRTGPVTISSTQPVIATLRAWFYQSLSEVPGS